MIQKQIIKKMIKGMDKKDLNFLKKVIDKELKNE